MSLTNCKQFINFSFVNYLIIKNFVQNTEIFLCFVQNFSKSKGKKINNLFTICAHPSRPSAPAQTKL